MKFGIMLGASAVLIAIPLAGCSGKATETTPPSGGENWGVAAEPCGISTGFNGDDLCIKPPPADMGFQAHYGPSDYTNQAELDKFIIQPGAEKTDCIYLKTPNDAMVYVNEYHGRMRPGSHHMLVYVIDGADIPTNMTPGSCNQGLNDRMLLGAQTEKIDIAASQSHAPENVGLAEKVPANSQLVMQLHFFNSSDQPKLREAWANVMYADPSTITQFSDPIYFIGGIGMNIPPGATQVLKGVATVPTQNSDGSPIDSVRLIKGTGHYHAHTVRFTAYSVIGGVRELLLEDYDWHDPTMFQFDSVLQNTPPNPTAKIAGAATGVKNFKPGDSIEWECEVVNTTDQPGDGAGAPTNLTFANEVYTGEMCNMFGLYAPSMGAAWAAASF